MKRIHVAAAVIRGPESSVLIAKRPLDKHQGGLWEFPGGKVEDGEGVESALARELQEELGIEVTQAQPLIQVRHDYPDKQVLLDVWEVLAFAGEPHGAEGQPLAWVAPEALVDYSFPAANQPIVTAARLPQHYLITPTALPCRVCSKELRGRWMQAFGSSSCVRRPSRLRTIGRLPSVCWPCARDVPN